MMCPHQHQITLHNYPNGSFRNYLINFKNLLNSSLKRLIPGSFTHKLPILKRPLESGFSPSEQCTTSIWKVIRKLSTVRVGRASCLAYSIFHTVLPLPQIDFELKLFLHIFKECWIESTLQFECFALLPKYFESDARVETLLPIAFIFLVGFSLNTPSTPLSTEELAFILGCFTPTVLQVLSKKPLIEDLSILVYLSKPMPNRIYQLPFEQQTAIPTETPIAMNHTVLVDLRTYLIFPLSQI